MNRTSTPFNLTKTSNTMPSSFSYKETLLKVAVVFILIFTLCIASNAQPCSSMVCRSSLNVSLGPDCTAGITPSMLLVGPANCPAIGTVVIMNGAGVPIPTGATITGAYIGQTLTAKFTQQWGNSCWTTLNIEDKLGPNINCQDVTINCLENPAPSNIGTPAVVDNCGTVSNVSYTDNVMNFGCAGGGATMSTMGFAGQFAPNTWNTVLTPTTSPSGVANSSTVNTSTAPSCITLTGAQEMNPPNGVNPRYVISYQHTVTAYGKVMFDWTTTGLVGSNLNFDDGFYFTVNDSCWVLSKNGITSGTYMSKNLKPGDVIKFEQTSNGDWYNASTKICNFKFTQSSMSCITRTWTATDNLGNTSTCSQKIIVTKALTNNVIYYPKNYDDVQLPSIPCGANANATDPQWTGYPYVDDDGNLATTNDRHYITGNVNGCITASYSDQVIPACPGSKTILRLWTIIETCGGNTAQYTQIIKVLDKTPPVISCPTDITLSANPTNCNATVQLPIVVASDACSGTSVNVTATWTFGSGFGPFNNVTPGIHTVTYKATDGCGNVATCTMRVTIKDLIPPVPVAQNVVTSITLGGIAKLNASVFDDGSVDNCCISSFEVKRADDLNAPFGMMVQFTCNDVGKTIMVIFKVNDCAGNSNTAMVSVEVQDKLPPIFTSCPPNQTVPCGTNLDNLSSFGSPIAVDNCSFVMTYSETKNIDNCGVGTITRTWVATDPGGRTATCSQVITVYNSTPWNPNNDKITWPLDYTEDACTNLTAMTPPLLPLPYREPIFKDLNGCTIPAVNYKDELFTVGTSACFKILRKWTIIDWCQYKPNDPLQKGRWEHVQVILVNDHQVPNLVIPKDTIIYAQDANCIKSNISLWKATATDCSPNVTITNDHNSGGADASGIYNYGQTKIKFTAVDGCGNVTTKEMNVTILDGKKPTPTCFHGLAGDVVNMNGQGMLMIRAKQFDAGSYDNCTPKNKLRFAFSKNPNDTLRIFTCDSLGLRGVNMWVIDETGNADFCSTYIHVQNNMGACSPTPTSMASVAGAIQTEITKNVEKVIVTVDYSNGFPSLSNIFGTYKIINLPLGNNYKVTPIKRLNPKNGVTTFDIYSIHRHILGIQPLGSPYKIIAADIDHSNNLTTKDLVELKKLVLGTIDSFSNNTSWRFVSKNFVFTNPNNPFTAPFPEVVNVNNVNGQVNNVDFIGVKIGDVNDSALPDSKMDKAAPRFGGAIELNVQNEAIKRGSTYTVAFRAKDFQNILGYQFTLGFDAKTLQFAGTEAGTLSDINDGNFGFSQLDEGLLTTSWFSSKANATTVNDDDVLFKLKFVAQTDGQLSDILKLNSRVTSAEAYDEQGQLLDVVLKFNHTTTTSNGNETFELYQNQPNPFGDVTTISFNLPEAAPTVVTIYDATGKVVKRYQSDYEKGYHQIEVSKSDLGANGVYTYRLSSAKYSATKKMVVFE